MWDAAIEVLRREMHHFKKPILEKKERSQVNEFSFQLKIRRKNSVANEPPNDQKKRNNEDQREINEWKTKQKVDSLKKLKLMSLLPD